MGLEVFWLDRVLELDERVRLDYLGYLEFARGAMLAKILHWVLAFAVGVLGTAALAQVPGSCGPLGVGAMVYGVPGKTNVPYSATVRTTYEQKLADGNSIHDSATTHQARDSAGRTMNETAQGCTVGADGRVKPMVRITVYDPATKTSMSWTVSDQAAKVVRVFHQTPPARPAAPANSAEIAQRREAMAAQQRLWRSEHHSENLGSKDIAGVMADGARSIRTIPVGEEGNDKPIESSDEVWVAKGLGLTMLKISDDPRSGRTTTEVMELNQTEPDAALFVAPAGYTLEEQVVKSVSSAGSQ
jgi:hypothetical protein